MKPSVITTNLEQIVRQIAQSEITRLTDQIITPDGTHQGSNSKRFYSNAFLSVGVGVDGVGSTVGSE